MAVTAPAVPPDLFCLLADDFLMTFGSIFDYSQAGMATYPSEAYLHILYGERPLLSVAAIHIGQQSAGFNSDS